VLRPRADQVEREFLELRIVSDEQDLADPRADFVHDAEHVRRRPVIKAVLIEDLGLPLQFRQHERKRVPRPPRRGAQHEIGIEPVLGHGLAHHRRLGHASRVERTIMIGKGRILPTRLRVAEQDQSQHGETY
jgi:hypothetical protein